MFAGKSQVEHKNKGIIIGYDLGKEFAQISYTDRNATEVKTVSSVAGTEQYNIPTVLCKRRGYNQWFYGKEAIKYAGEEDGILVEDLVSLAEQGEEVVVDGESFDPVALLTLFVKRSLSLFTQLVSLSEIEAFMFTVEELGREMVPVLAKVARGISLQAEQVLFQSHIESFYYYMLHQKEELWHHQVMAFDFGQELKSLSMECNQQTKPKVVLIQSNRYPEMKPAMEGLDQEFLRIAQGEMDGGLYSTVYLLGDGFKGNWASEALKFLCRGRRVFQGNNLYSKGACYGALERIAPSKIGKEHVYLGAEKLKSNVGMKVQRKGEESYFAILDAGSNWYEISNDFDVILEEGNTLDFIVTPLTGGKISDKRIVLEGLPERPKRTTRLQIHVEMTAVDQMTVTIEDMGFGEFFASSGKGWTQTITV